MENLDTIRELNDKAYMILLETNKLQYFEELKRRVEDGSDVNDFMVTAFLLGYMANEDFHIRNVKKYIDGDFDFMTISDYIEFLSSIGLTRID